MFSCRFTLNFYQLLPIHRDALATACINSFTSLFSGFVIFCYLGYMAKRLGTDIDKVATEGKKRNIIKTVKPELAATRVKRPAFSYGPLMPANEYLSVLNIDLKENETVRSR